MAQRPFSRINYLNDVVYGVANLLGIDTTYDLLKDHARGFSTAINGAFRYAWELWDWPELTVTEERALRQVWHSDVTYSSGQGENSELYYLPNETYYSVIGNPPVGTIPPGHSDITVPLSYYFAEIPFNELDKHIAYEQHGKQDIGQIYAVYGSSPRTNTPAWRWTASPSGVGLDVSLFTGTTVWITYKPRPPKFSTNAYKTTIAYSRGDTVLDLDSGDCYVALTASTGQALNLPAYWLRQEFPYILSEYVQYAAASDQADDVIMKQSLSTQADMLLYREIDKSIEQGEKHFYGPNRTGYRLPLGTSGFLWSVNAVPV
jgi:hypothetical protein